MTLRIFQNVWPKSPFQDVQGKRQAGFCFCRAPGRVLTATCQPRGACAPTPTGSAQSCPLVAASIPWGVASPPLETTGGGLQGTLLFLTQQNSWGN